MKATSSSTPEGRRRGAVVLAALALLASVAIARPAEAVQTPPPGSGCPGWACDPAPTTQDVDLFVLGDSWAQPGNSSVAPTTIPPEFNPTWLFDVYGILAKGAFDQNSIPKMAATGKATYRAWATLGAGLVRPAVEQLTTSMLGSGPITRFHVVNEHSWGIGGSTAAQWAQGKPCLGSDSGGGNAAGCAWVDLDSTDMVTPMMQMLAATPNKPIIYLSLGGNDLLGVGATHDILGAERASTLQTLKANLDTLVTRIINTRSDARIIIPGYTAFDFRLPRTVTANGTTYPDCVGFWREMFKASWVGTAYDTNLTSNLTKVDHLFFNASNAGDTTLDKVYRDLAIAHSPQLTYAPQWNWASQSALPPAWGDVANPMASRAPDAQWGAAGNLVDCFHLNTTGFGTLMGQAVSHL